MWKQASDPNEQVAINLFLSALDNLEPGDLQSFQISVDYLTRSVGSLSKIVYEGFSFADLAKQVGVPAAKGFYSRAKELKMLVELPPLVIGDNKRTTEFQFV